MSRGRGGAEDEEDEATVYIRKVRWMLARARGRREEMGRSGMGDLAGDVTPCSEVDMSGWRCASNHTLFANRQGPSYSRIAAGDAVANSAGDCI